MCWLTYKKECTECRIATEDIPIYKVLYNTLRSLYRFYEYSLNKVYSMEINSPYEIPSKIRNSHYSITLGFHSYSPSMTYTRVYHDLFWTVNSNNKGMILDTFTNTNNTVKVKGFIPKGSHYYLNENGEYVSDSIVLTEIIKNQQL